jgi:hypothetical protein
MRPPPGGTPGQSRSASGAQYLMICRIWIDCAKTAAGSDKITIADAPATANLRKATSSLPLEASLCTDGIGVQLANAGVVTDSEKEQTRIRRRASGRVRLKAPTRQGLRDGAASASGFLTESGFPNRWGSD